VGGNRFPREGRRGAGISKVGGKSALLEVGSQAGLLPGILDQNSPHGFGSGGEEMATGGEGGSGQGPVASSQPIITADWFLASGSCPHQAQICLVDERCRLQRLSRLLVR